MSVYTYKYFYSHTRIYIYTQYIHRIQFLQVIQRDSKRFKNQRCPATNGRIPGNMLAARVKL